MPLHNSFLISCEILGELFCQKCHFPFTPRFTEKNLGELIVHRSGLHGSAPDRVIEVAIAIVIAETLILGPAFGRTDFSRIFIFEPPDFFADFLAGFFLLIFVGKSAQKNPPGKSPGKSSKIYTAKILRHISADCPGQLIARSGVFCRGGLVEHRLAQPSVPIIVNV